jgi:hypothetical protein
MGATGESVPGCALAVWAKQSRSAGHDIRQAAGWHVENAVLEARECRK